MSVTQQDISNELNPRSFISTLSVFDWVWAAILFVGSIYAYQYYSLYMNSYEVGILFGVSASLIGLGWYWKQTRIFMLIVAMLSLFAISQYAGDISQATQRMDESIKCFLEIE